MWSLKLTVVKLDRYSPVTFKRWLLTLNQLSSHLLKVATREQLIEPSRDRPGQKKNASSQDWLGTLKWNTPPKKQIWQRNIAFSNRRYIFKCLVFEGVHCLTFPAYIQVGANLIDYICGVIFFASWFCWREGHLGSSRLSWRFPEFGNCWSRHFFKPQNLEG